MHSTQEALQQRVAAMRSQHPPQPAPEHRSDKSCAVRITGHALRDAYTSIERGTCNAVLTVAVQQPGDELPVVAELRYDNTPSSHTVAHHLALRLRAGTPVTLYGRGLRVAHLGTETVLRLADVQAIDAPTEPTTRKDLE